MDVTVVYETLYGSTRALAEALAEGVRAADPQAAVSVLSVDEASPDRLADTALLLAGGPTHALGMSRASTRRSGREGKDCRRPRPARRPPRSPRNSPTRSRAVRPGASPGDCARPGTASSARRPSSSPRRPARCATANGSAPVRGPPG
jgi:hypothetical protein